MTMLKAEHNMLKFAALSNQLLPDYICPSCRDPLLPSLRNSFLDFKLAASLTTLNALIGFEPEAHRDWKLASIDLLGFLNSRFYGGHTAGQLSSGVDLDHMIDLDIDITTL